MTEEKKHAGEPAGEAAGAAPGKKRSRRAPMAVAVVAAVVVAAGAGLWVWHEQPSFCNAFCHVAMDPYLPTYEAEPGQAAVDKWGNEVADANGMMAASHRAADPGTTCMTCHVPALSEQVSEGIAWVAGDYDVVAVGGDGFSLVERSLDDLVAARGLESGEQFCLNQACHANDDGTPMTRADLIELTSDLPRNPHVEQHEKVDCGTCHKAHRASVNYCAKCHEDSTVPEGWLYPSEEGRLEYRAN